MNPRTYKNILNKYIFYKNPKKVKRPTVYLLAMCRMILLKKKHTQRTGFKNTVIYILG